MLTSLWLAIVVMLSVAPSQVLSQSLSPAATSPLAAGAHRFTADGVELWYRVAGADTGIPVVFLQLGVSKIVLLGHSFGTQLSLEYAVKYPEHTAVDSW